MSSLQQLAEKEPAGSAERAPDASAMAGHVMVNARAAQIRWGGQPVAHRLKLLRQLRHLMVEHAAELAEASAAPHGRPSLESLTAEVFPLVGACRFLERNGKKILAPRSLHRKGRPLLLTGVRAMIHREPFGVVLIIAPGNYPLLLPGMPLLQALAAGNAVLLKPGRGGSSVAEFLQQLLLKAGFDRDLVAVLPEHTAAGEAAIAARPDKILFTGSSRTGEKILAQLAPELIPATMELGGSDAVLVRADADLALAARALAFGMILNGGRTCIAPKRVYVHREVADALAAALKKSFVDVNLAGRSGAIPPSNEVASLLNEATSDGASFLVGSATALPAALIHVSPSARLLREDLFAPVLALVAVGDDDEAVARANDSSFALGASVFTRDEAGGRRLAERLNAGVVTVNDLIIPTSDPRLPFGGRARSGFGVTRGCEGLLELTRTKVVTVSRARFRPAFEPARPQDEPILRAFLQLTNGRGWKRRARALLDLARMACGGRK